jgi:hypothetical protein
MKMIVMVLAAKLFTALAIVSLILCVYGAAQSNINLLFAGLCGIVVFANLASKYIRKSMDAL